MLTIVVVGIVVVALICVAMLLTTRSGGRRGSLDQSGVHMHGQEMQHRRSNGFQGPNTF